MGASELFPELACKATLDLAVLQDYAPLKSLMISTGTLSKVLVAIKSKTGDGSSTSLNKAVDEFKKAAKKLEDYGVGIVFEFIVYSL